MLLARVVRNDVAHRHVGIALALCAVVTPLLGELFQTDVVRRPLFVRPFVAGAPGGCCSVVSWRCLAIFRLGIVMVDVAVTWGLHMLQQSGDAVALAFLLLGAAFLECFRPTGRCPLGSHRWWWCWLVGWTPLRRTYRQNTRI